LRLWRRYRNIIAGESPKDNAAVPTEESSAAYWSRCNVTNHHPFATDKESLDYFEWRCALYSNYIESMPVNEATGLDVMDYGCGPGHDLVGFWCHSQPRRLVGVDVSPTSLAEARERLKLHAASAEFVLIHEDDPRLPFEDASFDLVHSSGVLHHAPAPLSILREIRRVLRPSGHAQIMVYNFDSIFVRLGVAYQLMLIDGESKNGSLAEAFQRSTDGPECPISRYYTADEFSALAREAGFSCALRGVGISTWEMQLLPKRFDALTDRRLAPEHRQFLYDLGFDQRGRPTYGGQIAGIDACYRLTPLAG